MPGARWTEREIADLKEINLDKNVSLSLPNNRDPSTRHRDRPHPQRQQLGPPSQAPAASDRGEWL